MGEMIRAHDWRASPIGPSEDWPQVLRILVALMLTSSQPMFIVWGASRIMLYNDAYSEILAEKHPALGRPFHEVWHEIWDRDLKPIVDRAYAGEALHMDDIPLVMMRRGYPEETHFSFSYTPVRGPDGKVHGFFCPCLEITDQVLEKRRARLRAELNERLRGLHEPAEMTELAMALLAQHLGVEQSIYAEIDPTGEYAIIESDWNDGRMASNVGRHRLEDFGSDFIADLKAGRSIAIGDIRADPRTSSPEAVAAFEARGVRAFLSVPLLLKGQLIAVLGVNSAAPKYWHPDDIALVEEVAGRTNAALRSARAEAARRASEESLRRTRDALALATEASQLGWYSWDFATGAATADPRARQVIGLASAADAIADWEARIHPEDRAAVRAEIASCLREARPFDLEYRVLHADGAELHVHGTGIFAADEAGAPLHGTGLVRDITERKRSEQRQTMLMAELDHRVKNILAVVQSIARQSLGRGRTAETEAATLLAGRIDALARSHTLLASSRWEGARFGALVETAVAPYRGARPGRIEARGPDLKVTPKAAQTLTLALHEMVTNAGKYGALSAEDGQVTARWRLAEAAEEPRLIFDWQESGGPPITAEPAQRGFGSLLIEHTLAYDLGGRVSLDFAPGGLHAVIELPLGRLRVQPTPGIGEFRPETPPPAPVGTALEGLRVLLVEDEHLVGRETAAALRSGGMTVFGPLPSVEQALKVAVAEDFDAAVLDVNLGGERVWPVARAVRARGIPVLFATGYTESIGMLPEFTGTPWLEKPFDTPQLLAALAAAVAASAPA
ncbi:HWE histidine kinase domain-containing protein [Roseivivax sp. CAU 1761]